MFSEIVLQEIDDKVMSLREEKQLEAMIKWFVFCDSVSGEEDSESGGDEEICTPEHPCLDCIVDAMGD